MGRCLGEREDFDGAAQEVFIYCVNARNRASPAWSGQDFANRKHAGAQPVSTAHDLIENPTNLRAKGWIRFEHVNEKH
jgi:hypothetical protein